MRKKSEDSKNGANRIISGVGFEKGKNALPPRISSAVCESVARKKALQLSIFDMLQEQAPVSAEASSALALLREQGMDGVSLSLSSSEALLTTLLSGCIPFGEQDVADYIAMLEASINGKATNAENVSRFSIVGISAKDMCKAVYGDAKPSSLQRFDRLLSAVSERVQPVLLRFKDKNGDERGIIRTEPLISVAKNYLLYDEARDKRGRKSAKREVANTALLETFDVSFSPIFLFRADTFYFQFPPEKLAAVWREHNNDLFKIMFYDLGKMWRQHYGFYCQGKEGQEHYAIKTDSLKDMCQTDYSSTRQQRKRFKTILEENIDGFVELGVITPNSRIREDGTCVDFYYNFDSYRKQIEENQKEK